MSLARRAFQLVTCLPCRLVSSEPCGDGSVAKAGHLPLACRADLSRRSRAETEAWRRLVTLDRDVFHRFKKWFFALPGWRGQKPSRTLFRRGSRGMRLPFWSAVAVTPLCGCRLYQRPEGRRSKAAARTACRRSPGGGRAGCGLAVPQTAPRCAATTRNRASQRPRHVSRWFSAYSGLFQLFAQRT